MPEVHVNPTPEELRAFTEAMPQARLTEFGNVNVQTRVTSRSAASTHVVGGPSSGKTMTREAFDEIAAKQDAYLAERDVVVIDGFIGNDPEMRTAARLTIEKANANIAGMQQKLYFERNDGAEPEVHVIYTPNLEAPGYTDDRLIAVDLENGVTRVLNSDYFGESKKGGLRMWNDIVYGKGGLALHAGLKVIPTDAGEKVIMIIGLSGTGKTTTTFTTQNGSEPVQDDFVGLMPGGHAYGTENGCFAKTFSLDPDVRAVDLRRGGQADHVPGERVPGRRGQGELLRGELHAERARGVRDVGPAALPRRARGRHGGLPADPQPEREHHPGRGQALAGAGRRVLHARRDHGHERRRRRRGRHLPARPGDEPVLPAAARAAGQPHPGAARVAPDRDVPAEHRAVSAARTTTTVPRS